jgi:hypothetical protein
VPTIQEVIDTARVTLNDAQKIRYPDAECLSYARDGLREACLARPDLFAVTDTVVCVAGVEQVIPPPGWFVIDVLRNSNGDDILECDFETLRQFNQAWRSETPGPTVNWMPFPRKTDLGPNNRFYVSPPAIAGQQLKAVWANLDADTLGLNDPVPGLTDQYIPGLEAYIIFRAESKDDEHVISARAALFRGAFETTLGIGKASENSQ